MANGKTEYRLAFGVGIDTESANTLRSRVAAILEQDDFGSLTFLFSSGGGNTDNSLALYNFILQLPVPVHMHGMGHIGSAAVPIFLAGTKRTCSPFSRFFFHEYDWGFDERQTLKRIDEAVKRLESDIQLARDIMRSRTRLPADILNALDGGAEPAVVGPAQAKTHGLVEDILELSKTGTNGMNVAVWNA